MADILPGYTWSQSAARYRDVTRGQFVSRARIQELLANQINTAEQRMGTIVTAMFEKQLAPGMGQTLLRDELRRLSLQNVALAKGGMDKLDFRDYGRVGRQLRDTYARVGNLTRDMEAGKVSIDQALNRVRGYAGEARVQFFQAEREALRGTGKVFEQRRRLNPAEHCRGCVRYASMGWRPLGELPPPGDGSTPCGSYCRCTMETREVTPETVRERLNTQLERMMATQ